MIGYARIYNFYTTNIIRLLRFVIFIFLLWSTYQSVSNSFFLSASSRISIFLLSVFLILEVFFRFKISRLTPRVSISENEGKNIYTSFTFKSLYVFLGKTTSIIKLLLKEKSSLFILEKSDIRQNEVSLIDISKEDLGAYSLEVSKNLKGKFVTTMDILVSYLLLTEDKTKLLFNKNLKKEELMHILYWARLRFSDEENPKPFMINFWGEGIGEGMVSGWTIETKKYMVDKTSEILRKRTTLFGKESEYRQILEALYQQKSVILVGEQGVGKEEIIESLAFESFTGSLRGSLYHQRFFELLIDALIAGSQNQGELESRLDAIIAELAHSGNIIVYIPSFENILGSSSFHIDLSGVLAPYLERGVIRIIATVSLGAYKKFVEARKTLMNAFQVVKLEEPDKDLTLQMLFRKTLDIEGIYSVDLTYKSVIAAATYGKQYLPGSYLPGAAFELLKDTANMVFLRGKKIVEEEDVIEKVKTQTKIAIGKPKGKEKELLLHLENEMHKRIIDQEEAVSEVSEAMRRLRTGITTLNKPISFLFLGPTGVGKTETAKTLAALYFGGENKMIRLDMSEYSGDDAARRLLGSLPGEEEERGELTDKVYDNPFSLILLDEFEKANINVLNLFLQVLDDGRLTDNKGRTVSFVNAIIIATSNAASEFIREEIGKGATVNKKFQEKLLEFLQTKGIFKPELLNRFDGIIVFKPLGQGEVVQVIKLLLSELSRKMQEQDVAIIFDDKIIEKIINEGFDEQFGARPLRRYIQDNIEDLIAQKILKDEIKRGDKISVSTDGNQFLISKS